MLYMFVEGVPMQWVVSNAMAVAGSRGIVVSSAGMLLGGLIRCMQMTVDVRVFAFRFQSVDRGYWIDETAAECMTSQGKRVKDLARQC